MYIIEVRALVKKHQVSIILLFLAVISFVMKFIVAEKYEIYCDIAAFALPMVATLIEIALSIKADNENESRDRLIEDLEDCLTWKN